MAASTALVAAESILALTPIAIKKTPLDPISTLWSRILPSAGIGYTLTTDKHLTLAEQAGAVALGGTNLLHIAASYEAFRNLPAGQAMSLLYTYPVWNLVFGTIYSGESINGRDWLLMGVAAVGSFFLNLDPSNLTSISHTTDTLGRRANASWGIFMGLIMALTESAMHTILREIKWLDPSKAVWIVNSSAGIWLMAISLLQITLFGPINEARGTWGDFIWLSVFHGVTMFSGYWLRFYAVPRLSTVTYSILSYAGLLAAFIFGAMFIGERPGWMSIIGAVLIMLSGVILQQQSLIP